VNKIDKGMRSFLMPLFFAILLNLADVQMILLSFFVAGFVSISTSVASHSCAEAPKAAVYDGNVHIHV
jgi:hypothetical protein